MIERNAQKLKEDDVINISYRQNIKNEKKFTINDKRDKLVRIFTVGDATNDHIDATDPTDFAKQYVKDYTNLAEYGDKIYARLTKGERALDDLSKNINNSYTVSDLKTKLDIKDIYVIPNDKLYGGKKTRRNKKSRRNRRK
jgi:hypothetical protein